jgi:Micro-tubular organiser Mto1 C-term Mto2-binding region
LTNKQSEYNELLSKSRTKGLREKDIRDTPSPGPRTVATTSAAANATSTNASPSNASPSQGGSAPGADKRWLLRFQELETRLKAEQEGRALDQKGAKLRLDEVRKENAELKSEIGKEKDGTSVRSMTSVNSSKENLKARETGNGSA